jgi:restriction endonuclease S subunit
MDGLEAVEMKLSELEFSLRLDSEYYKKGFIEIEKKIIGKNYLPLNKVTNFLIGPFGSAFNTENYDDTSNYRYVRGQDVKPFFIVSDNDPKFMPEKDYLRLEKYALKENDILVSVVGTLGNASIVYKKELPALFSCKSTVLRNIEINPYYLLTYFNCNIGKNMLLRKTRGAIQTGLNLDDLKTFSIFIAEKKMQEKIEILIKDSYEKIEQSKQLYGEVENILLEELGLKEWKPSEKNIEVKSFKESFGTSGRLDAEYYQPKYDEIEEHIRKYEVKYLNEIVTIKKSIEPGTSAYSDEGIPFVRVSNLSKFELTEPDIKISPLLAIEELKPKKDTILLTKDGSVGIAYKVEQDLNVITSGAILHLNILDKNILPDYLTTVLNSLIVKLQAQRDSGGSIIQHWRIGDIEKIMIPILPMTIQEEISKKRKESFVLKEKSKQVLEIAKLGVEKAIEEDEENAMNWVEAEVLKIETDKGE